MCSISDSYEICDKYQLSSVSESFDTSSDSDSSEARELRRRKKRAKKGLPEDFISSQNLDGMCLQAMLHITCKKGILFFLYNDIYVKSKYNERLYTLIFI